MFEDLRQAWKEAVDNFWRELEVDGDPAHADEPRKRLAVMRRELQTADDDLRRLDVEIGRTRNAIAAERREEAVCRRRETMATGIGDTETARLAATYALRAGERAAVLERKAEALAAERELRARDLGEMRTAVDAAVVALGSGMRRGGAAAGASEVTGGDAPGAATGSGAGAGGGAAADDSSPLGEWPGTGPTDEERLKQEHDFRRMNREAREKAAQARLEELKRSMK